MAIRRVREFQKSILFARFGLRQDMDRAIGCRLSMLMRRCDGSSHHSLYRRNPFDQTRSAIGITQCSFVSDDGNVRYDGLNASRFGCIACERTTRTSVDVQGANVLDQLNTRPRIVAPRAIAWLLRSRTMAELDSAATEPSRSAPNGRQAVSARSYEMV